jgi:hypothetical protein
MKPLSGLQVIDSFLWTQGAYRVNPETVNVHFPFPSYLALMAITIVSRVRVSDTRNRLAS